jgi:hypothetical protein
MEFYAKYDRRHDASFVLTYDATDRWTFSTVFVYGTGNAATLPRAWYLFENRITYEYMDRNSYRLAPYHRLDIAATLNPKKNKRFQSGWTFAIFNVYNRMNPFFIYFDSQGQLGQTPITNSAKQVSLFPVIPSVTWNFKF